MTKESNDKVNDIIIRKAKTQDAKQFVKLNNFVWRIAYKDIFPEEVFLEREAKAEEKIKKFDKIYCNNNKFLTYVAECDSKIVGILWGAMKSEYEYFGTKSYADLMALYIHPDYQGLKISSKFKKTFEDWAKENGATKYVIGVLKDNHKARRVYENWGGKLDAQTQPFVKLGVGYEEVFYTYDLK